MPDVLLHLSNHESQKRDSCSIKIFTYKRCKYKLVLVILGTVLSFGLLLIVLNWKKSWKLNMLRRRCDPQEAELVLLQDEYGCYYEETIHHAQSGAKFTQQGMRLDDWYAYFIHQKIKYILSTKENHFFPIKTFDMNRSFEFFHSQIGLKPEEVLKNRHFYGDNKIDVDATPTWKLIISEVSNPFYLFQLYAVIIWSIVNYELFAVTIFILSVISLTWTICEVRQQSRALRRKIMEKFTVKTLRNKEMISISMDELVPGDVLLLTRGEKLLMPCDAVLLEGHCVVNEAMLTGESTPVTKTALARHNTNDAVFDYTKHKDHVLFRGSEVLQAVARTNKVCKLLTIRTGFYTEKGTLIRSIMYPKPVDFRFLSDFYRFIPILLLFGFIGMIYSAIMWYRNGGTWKHVIFLSMDVITWCVPPLLPSSMAAISGYVQKSLRKSNVYCINSKSIYMTSAVNVMCFDKTGTLTEDGLELKGVVTPDKIETNLVTPVKSVNDDYPVFVVMGTCHSLCLIDGRVQGTPLEMQMFESTGWLLKKNNTTAETVVHNKTENMFLTIKKYFPFHSSLQSMTTLIEWKGELYVSTKGSPDRMAQLYKTLPDGYAQCVHLLQEQGLRILAAGFRCLNQDRFDIDLISRSEVERDLEFCGLLLFENPVKPGSYSVITTLHAADIETIMITGDSVETGISVGKKCSLLQATEKLQWVKVDGLKSSANNLHVFYEDIPDEVTGKPDMPPRLAVTGRDFDLIRTSHPQIYKELLRRGKIFGRMLPHQKVQLIEDLRDDGKDVGMCGDGSNDCGALKAAHFGVSLSSVSDASVAAPFTCVDIGTVPLLIRYGRAAYVSAMAVFKYSVTVYMSGFIFSLMLFYESNEPTSMQLLYLDFVLTIIPSMVYGFVGPSKKLHPKRPMEKLLSFIPVFSIFCFIIFQAAYYIAIWVSLTGFEWYEQYAFENHHGFHVFHSSHSETSMFYAHMWTYIIAAVVFSWGHPYRKSFLTNRTLFTWLVFGTAACLTITFVENDWINNFLHLKHLPLPFRLIIVGSSILCFALCYIWENNFINGFLFVCSKSRRWMTS